MERRRLGGTDLELSVIGLGTWVFGGRWGGAEDEASLAACHAALDAGVNWIDTADIYGQCTWYRSIWSRPSAWRERSQAIRR